MLLLAQPSLCFASVALAEILLRDIFLKLLLMYKLAFGLWWEETAVGRNS